MIDTSQVSIVIPHLGGTAEAEYALDQCVQSLKETVPDIRILISINGSRCFTHRTGQGDLYIKDQGQGKACNAAIATVNTPWIFVTNDDQIYSEGWWEYLTGGLDENVLCVSPKLIEPRPGAPTFEVYFCGGAGGDFDKEKWLQFSKEYYMKG